MSSRRDPGAGLRALAARLNDEVVSGGRSLTALEARADDIAERDRPLLRAMLNESLRWHHRYEWQLARLLERPLKRRDARLAALLRIGLTQLDVLRIPDHAAVSATVGAADLIGCGHARGLVNAVLRRYLRERGELADRAREELVPSLSHPAWLIEAVRRDWPDAWRSILDANNAAPPLWLRVNRQKGSRETYLAQLEASGLHATASPTASAAVLMAEPVAVSELPGFLHGLVSVQDLGAQLAAELLAPRPGMRVLDACAAPGGKTGHLLELCPDLEELVALDCDARRLERVASNLHRLGLEATLIQANAEDTGQWFSGRTFERILLDVPCSATGVIRRHPDIKVLRRATDISALAVRQAALLRALWPLLAPGGRLLYASCSTLKAENIGVVEPFVANQPDASLEPFGSATHFQLLPGETNTDGFYYACLTKVAGESN